MFVSVKEKTQEKTASATRGKSTSLSISVEFN